MIRSTHPATARMAGRIGRAIRAKMAAMVDSDKLVSLLGAENNAAGVEPVVLSCAAVRVRRGHELRLVIPSSTAPATPRTRDEKLVALVADAQAAREMVMASPHLSLNRIASDAGRCRTRLARLVALACLAPDIVVAIIEGRQPAALTATALARVDLPLGWPEQRTMLGVA